MIHIEKQTSRFALTMNIVRMGDDLCVSLHGGDKAHIGAVALAVPHAGLRDRKKVDASVSVLTVCGHKEDELARSIASELAKMRNCTVSVSCGIHLENASRQEIEAVLAAADELLQQAMAKLR